MTVGVVFNSPRLYDTSKPVLVNVKWAKESIPPGLESIPGLHRGLQVRARYNSTDNATQIMYVRPLIEPLLPVASVNNSGCSQIRASEKLHKSIINIWKDADIHILLLSCHTERRLRARKGSRQIKRQQKSMLLIRVPSLTPFFYYSANNHNTVPKDVNEMVFNNID